MTIQNTTIRKAGPSQGNGVTTVFPFTFKVFTATDILVTYLNALGVESVLVLSTNYTVSLNADQNTSPGGSVTLLVAPATATYITLTSQLANTQTLSLTNSGGFYPESINNALDRTVIEIQQLAEQASRSITIPKSSTASPLLPSPVANNVLVWNNAATALINLPATSGTSLVNLAASTGSTLVGTTNGGTGSVTRTVASKLNDTVSVKDFGAVCDGITDDTAAVQNALNASITVEMVGASCKVGQLAIPATCKSFFSKSMTQLIPASTVPSGATAAYWVYAVGLSDTTIEGMKFNASATTYPNLTILGLITCTDCEIKNNSFINSGLVAIYGANCVDVTVRNNNIKQFASIGIKFEGATQAQNLIIGNHVDSTISVSHGISFQLGFGNEVTLNVIRNVGSFGVAMYQVGNGLITANRIYNSKAEAINIEDSSLVIIKGNSCYWDLGSQSVDFGISIFGNASVAQYCIVEGNTVTNNGASGITLAGSVSLCSVLGNMVLNVNQLNIASHAGILLYGSTCFGNMVKNNQVISSSGTSYNYGISEWDFGTGWAGNNIIQDNRIAGYITGDIHTTNTSTYLGNNLADLSSYRTYTPVVTAVTGILTTASALGYYRVIGNIVDFYVKITITTNGTGATAILCTLPFSPVRGSGSGKEIAMSGKAVTAEINNANLNAIIRFYDNTYPAVNGSIISYSGQYQRS